MGWTWTSKNLICWEAGRLVVTIFKLARCAWMCPGLQPGTFRTPKTIGHVASTWKLPCKSLKIIKFQVKNFRITAIIFVICQTRRPSLATFPKEKKAPRRKLKTQRVRESFWRTLRCLKMRSNIVLSVSKIHLLNKNENYGEKRKIKS